MSDDISGWGEQDDVFMKSGAFLSRAQRAHGQLRTAFCDDLGLTANGGGIFPSTVSPLKKDYKTFVPTIPLHRPARKAIEKHPQGVPSLHDMKDEVRDLQVVTSFVFDPAIDGSSHRDRQKLAREGRESSQCFTPRPAVAPLQAGVPAPGSRMMAPYPGQTFQNSGFAAGLRTPDDQGLLQVGNSFNAVLLGQNPSLPRLRHGFYYAPNRPHTSGSPRIQRPRSPIGFDSKSPGLRSPSRPQSARQPAGPIELGIGIGSDADCIVLSSPRLRSRQSAHSRTSDLLGGSSVSPRLAHNSADSGGSPVPVEPVPLDSKVQRPTTASTARQTQSPSSNTPARPSTADLYRVPHRRSAEERDDGEGSSAISMPTSASPPITEHVGVGADITSVATVSQSFDTLCSRDPALQQRRFIPLTIRRLDSANRSAGRRNNTDSIFGAVKHHQENLSIYLGALSTEANDTERRHASRSTLPVSSPRNHSHQNHTQTASPRSRPMSARQGGRSLAARFDGATSNLTTVAEVGVVSAREVQGEAATPRTLLLRDGEDIKRRQEPIPQAASNIPQQMIAAHLANMKHRRPVLSSDHVLVGQGTGNLGSHGHHSPELRVCLSSKTSGEALFPGRPATAATITSTSDEKLQLNRRLQRPATAAVQLRQSNEEKMSTPASIKHKAAAAAMHELHRSANIHNFPHSKMGWISRSHSAESGPSAWHASPTGSPLKGVAAQTAPAEPASKNNLQEVLPRSHETVLPPRPARAKARKTSFSRSLLHIDSNQDASLANRIDGIAGSGSVIRQSEDFAVLGFSERSRSMSPLERTSPSEPASGKAKELSPYSSDMIAGANTAFESPSQED